MLAENGKDADLWVKFAVHHLRIFDVDKAQVCCREAIALKRRHPVALETK